MAFEDGYVHARTARVLWSRACETPVAPTHRQQPCASDTAAGLDRALACCSAGLKGIDEQLAASMRAGEQDRNKECA